MVYNNRPTKQAIGKIMKKFEETGMVTNIKRPVHHRFFENTAIVSESVAEDPNVSIPRRSRVLGLSNTALPFAKFPFLFKVFSEEKKFS